MAETKTNRDGIYLFTDLQPGAYKLTVSGKGFGDVIQDGITIEANRQRHFDATLTVAQTSTTGEVSGGVEGLQADRADLNANLSNKQVVDLPVTGTSGRNFESLMTIVPGAIMAGEQNSAAGNPQRAISFNMNGVSRLQNNTKVDGSSIIYPWLPTNIA